MKLSELELDPALVEEGVWREFDESDPDRPAVKIASMEKRSYKNKLGRMSLRAVTQARGREMDQTKRDDITLRSMVGTLVMGIRGFKNDDGSEIEFNDATTLDILSRFPDIRDFCQREAADYNNFRLRKDGADGAVEQTPPEARLKSGTEVLS